MHVSRSRWILAVLVLGLLFFALELRLFHLQIVGHARAERSVDSVVQSTETVLAGRGRIVDRNGTVLAESVPAIDVYCDARWTDRGGKDGSGRAALAKTLSDAGLGDAEVLRSALERPGYRRLFRQPIADGEQVVRLLELEREGKLPGIDLHRTFARRYPEGRLAAQVVGHVDAEGKGQGGLEQAFDALLRGGANVRNYEKDAARRALVGLDSEVGGGPAGVEVRTTLDMVIQYFAEEELDRIVQQFRPRWASAIVMRPGTGEVLALANRPTFDPNRYANYDVAAMRNAAVTLTYAPGSSFKPFMMAMALDAGRVRLGEKIDCENGTWNLGYRTIRDVHRYEMLTPAEIIAHSSNVGIVKLALRLVPGDDAPKEAQMAGLKAVRNRLLELGFGKATGIGLPGESGGVLTALKRWTRRYTLVSLAFGYEVQVTPLQLATAFGVFANAGRWIQPRLIAELGLPGGGVMERPWQSEVSVFDPVSTRHVSAMLQDVVEEGTAKECALDGWSMAGKTSTAMYEKPPRRYTSSFVGFAPAERPELLVLIVVDQPKGAHYGATVAAPAAREILQRSLNYLRVPQNRPTLTADEPNR